MTTLVTFEVFCATQRAKRFAHAHLLSHLPTQPSEAHGCRSLGAEAEGDAPTLGPAGTRAPRRLTCALAEQLRSRQGWDAKGSLVLLGLGAGSHAGPRREWQPRACSESKLPGDLAAHVHTEKPQLPAAPAGQQARPPGAASPAARRRAVGPCARFSSAMLLGGSQRLPAGPVVAPLAAAGVPLCTRSRTDPRRPRPESSPAPPALLPSLGLWFLGPREGRLQSGVPPRAGALLPWTPPRLPSALWHFWQADRCN